MKRRRGIVIALTVIIVGAIAAWGYSFFVAPESVEAISEKWSRSGHADSESESFLRWADDDPPEIPVVCAKCHSMDGYLDFVGADGSAAGSVDEPVLGVSVVGCRTCHSEPAHEMREVTFPSDIAVEEDTAAANCMQCHQGRRSTQDVKDAVAGVEPDIVSDDLGLINVHYAIAAATLLGGDAEVGYQYPGRSYVARFEHVENYDTCIECHDAHSTFRNPDQCSPCHLNVVDEADLREIRASNVDYDGDGDVSEPIYDEVRAFGDRLYGALQEYAAEVIGQPLVYDGQGLPYYFKDVEGELTFADQYDSWTPRLVKAAYNYHYLHQDPGAYVHNARYVMQLLYDSAEDLGEVVAVDLDGLTRP